MYQKLIFSLAVAAMSAVIGCTSSTKPTENGGSAAPSLDGPKEGTIKIISSLPRTGSAKSQTDTMVNGIKLALEEAGYKAGNFKIEYIDRDDASAATGNWTAEAETSNADEAVNDPDVMVYIGPFNSGAAKVSMPILNKADLLMISPANTWPRLTKKDIGDEGEPEIYRPTGRLNYTRVVPTDDLQGERGAAWAKEMEMKTVYVLDDGEVYGRGLAMLFEESAVDQGLKVLGHDTIDPRAQEFRSLMTKIKANEPDLIYFGGTTQTKGGQIAKDLVAAGLKSKLMVPDGCREIAFIEAAGADALNGRCYVTFGGVPPEQLTGEGAEFVKKYKEKFGGKPEAYASYGYEAANVALRAIKDAGVKNRRAIADAALAIKNFEGALGTWSFDENGDTDLGKMSGSIVKNGDFEFVKLLEK